MINAAVTDQYLSVNPKRAALLVQLDGCHSRNFSGLLDVCAVAADSETHEILSHRELLLER